jgi:hypothetical protein
MCVYSNVAQQIGPWIPQVPVYPQPYTPGIDPTQIIPDRSNEELRELLDTFKELLDAAAKVDEVTGQPDCADPEKTKVLERLDELEERLAEVEKTQARKSRRYA